MNLRLRFLVLQRDGFTCRYCGHAAPDVQLEVDHIIPRSKGGGDEPSNLVTACRDCNQGKAAVDSDLNAAIGWWWMDFIEGCVDETDNETVIEALLEFRFFPTRHRRPAPRHTVSTDFCDTLDAVAARRRASSRGLGFHPYPFEPEEARSRVS